MIEPHIVVVSGVACLFGHWIACLITGSEMRMWFIVGVLLCVAAILISHYAYLVISRGK